MRVAMWQDKDGRNGELSLPLLLLERWRTCENLRSIQDKAMLAVLDELLSERRVAIERKLWPEWLVEATRGAHAWQSRHRLVALTMKLREAIASGAAPGAAPDAALGAAAALYAKLEAWRKQDKHLYEWECNQRENVLAARRDIYRTFAAHVVAQYDEVRVEDLDLRDFAELPDEAQGDEPDSPIKKNARPRRFKAALSELFGAMRDATLRAGGAWTTVDPAWTTQTCSVCGHREEFDAAKQLEHTCSACGATWDQDINARVNILRAPAERIVSTTRSRDEKLKKSERARRRAEGLAKARAKRKDKRSHETEEV
jgi:hypothetical protein